MEDLNFNPANFFLAFLLLVVVSILLFLLFRELFCWYWKINKRISMTEKQIVLLEKILSHLKSVAPNPNPSQYEEEVSEKILIDDKVTDFNQDIYESLSITEQKEADKFIKHGLRLGEKLVINKTTREINRFSIKEWKEICEKLEDENWIIIWERKLNSV